MQLVGADAFLARARRDIPLQPNVRRAVAGLHESSHSHGEYSPTSTAHRHTERGARALHPADKARPATSSWKCRAEAETWPSVFSYGRNFRGVQSVSQV